MKKKILLLLLALGLVFTGCKKAEEKYALVPATNLANDNQGKEETKTITEKEETSYPIKEVVDESLKKGEKVVTQKGKKGISEIIYKVTYVNGQETMREAISEKIIERPIPEIVHIASKADSLASEEKSQESSETRISRLPNTGRNNNSSSNNSNNNNDNNPNYYYPPEETNTETSDSYDPPRNSESSSSTKPPASSDKPEAPPEESETSSSYDPPASSDDQEAPPEESNPDPVEEEPVVEEPNSEETATPIAPME